MKVLRMLTMFLASAAALPAAAAPADDARALEVLKRSIAFYTVDGKDNNQILDYAAYLKGVLTQAGYADGDVRIVPVGKTAYLTARYPGADAAARPIVLLAHMDVVDAKREDWERDPFTAIVEDGHVYGRGASDNKAGLSLVVSTLAKLRREGWKPRRDIILVLTGDEETMMTTTRQAAAELKHAAYVLNADSGGGTLGADGKPGVYSINLAEKTYADFRLTVTDKGGHSSAPTPGNPIYRLARGLDKLSTHTFPAMHSDMNVEYYRVAARSAEGPLKAAMELYVANPADERALASLSAVPEQAGRLRTTCVATQIEGGHAVNALPQRAVATVNCRIFPGVPIEEVQETMATVMGDPTIAITQLDSGSVATSPTVLPPDMLASITRAIRGPYPDIQIISAMSSGASDSMHFRALGVPSFGTSGIVTPPGGRNGAHGLNERFPLSAIPGALAYWDTLLREVAGK